MRDEKLRKELVCIDFIKKRFLFYTVSVTSVGYNEVQVSVVKGKLGNRGRETLTTFEKKDALKNALKFAYKHIYDQKADGYVSSGKLTMAIDSLLKEEKEAKKSKKKQRQRTTPCVCDLCQKEVKKEVYNKIDAWARGGGNWDSDPNFIGYQKVLCLECQIEHDIYKKKIEKKK